MKKKVGKCSSVSYVVKNSMPTCMLKLWSCEGRQSETIMLSSPRHRDVEEEKNVNENGDIEYEAESDSTGVLV